MIANWAVEGVVDEEEFHDGFAGLLNEFGVRKDFHSRGYGEGAGGLWFRRADDFDEAHAAVAGDEEAFVVAEARDFDAYSFAGLEDGGAGGDSDVDSVDHDVDEVQHGGGGLGVVGGGRGGREGRGGRGGSWGV